MLGLLNSRRMQCVLSAIIHIAGSPQAVSGKLLAQKMNLPHRYLEPDMQSLVQCGILESRRGAGGGYSLARSPQRISLLDILQCLASSDAKADAVEADELQRRILQPGLQQVGADIEAVLANVNLAAWLRQAEEQGLITATRSTPDFCI